MRSYRPLFEVLVATGLLEVTWRAWCYGIQALQKAPHQPFAGNIEQTLCDCSLDICNKILTMMPLIRHNDPCVSAILTATCATVSTATLADKLS